VALRLLELGAGTVVVTLGAAGAMIFRHRDGAAPRSEEMAAHHICSWAESVFGLPVHPGPVVDTTGAGDSVVAALMYQMLTGLPDRAAWDSAFWIEAVEFALRVSAFVCARRGGAVAMPTLAELAT
jgi:fructokinase